MRFADANIFIRFLAEDEPRMTAAAADLLRRVVAGEEEILISEIVLSEIVYVVSSRNLYAMSNSELSLRLRSLLAIDGIRLDSKPRCLRALAIYGEHRFLDFEDAMAIAYMEEQGISEIYSFDRDFDRVDGVTRIEP